MAEELKEDKLVVPADKKSAFMLNSERLDEYLAQL